MGREPGKVRQGSMEVVLMFLYRAFPSYLFPIYINYIHAFIIIALPRTSLESETALGRIWRFVSRGNFKALDVVATSLA